MNYCEYKHADIKDDKRLNKGSLAKWSKALVIGTSSTPIAVKIDNFFVDSKNLMKETEMRVKNHLRRDIIDGRRIFVKNMGNLVLLSGY